MCVGEAFDLEASVSDEEPNVSISFEENGTSIGSADTDFAGVATRSHGQSTPGTYTYKATHADYDGSNEVTVTVVGVKEVKYSLDGGTTYQSATGTVYVPVGITVQFEALPDPSSETFPQGWPAWENATPMMDDPELAEATFNTVSPNIDSPTIVKVKCGTSEKQIEFIVVGVQKLQYKQADETYADVPDPLYVKKGDSVQFKALLNPSDASWPSEKPEWGGSSGASGTGSTISITFDTVSEDTSDFKTVEAECGNTVAVNVLVVDWELLVRAKKSTDPDEFADTAAVCAGGMNSNAHTAEIEITTTPPVSGFEIETTLSGGDGEVVAALLDIPTTTDSNGKITGRLISSDKVESATLDAEGKTATVNFNWEVEWTEDSWVSDPEQIAPTSTETIELIHHGEPVNGHIIRFVVEEITYVTLDTWETVTTINPDEIAPYASFGTPDPTTGSDGKTSQTLVTTEEDVLMVEEKLAFFDLSVYDGAAGLNGDGPPSTTEGHPGKTVTAPVKGEFSDDVDFPTNGGRDEGQHNICPKERICHEGSTRGSSRCRR